MSSDNQNYRQLRAIIFADIVGYTSMMQDGENAALLTLQRFESITQECVAKHQGEVIKNYGDGSLMLFDSTVHAVQCAHDMQIAFQQEPKVPLRIGIHIGEVVRRDKDIFGHGVNISSRIESLGVAGSVLVSKMIYDKVRNQEGFSFESMGIFDFKNVDEGMQVFALANKGITVPKLSEMKGKVKENKQSLWSNPTARVVGMVGLVALLVLGGVFMLSKSNAQKPVTETVKIIDEDGATTERVVFNRSLNNRLVVFPTKTSGLTGEDEWLNLALPILQESDLEQDPRITVIGPLGIRDALKENNKELFDDTSFSVKRKIAEDRNVDNFVVPSCSKNGQQYDVSYKVYSTKDGKEVLSKQYLNDDIFAIVDGFSSDFNDYLYSDLGEVKTVSDFADLPVRDLKTDNFSALINYVKARYTSRIDNDIATAISLIDESIASDPEFMAAYYEKGNMLCAQRNMTEGLVYFDKAAEFFTGQPERVTLGIKTQKSLFQNDVEKATRLGEMWQKLYPQNTEAYSILNMIYSFSGEFDKKVALWQAGYDAGHKSGFLLELGNLYLQKGEFDEAEKYYEEYQELYPSKQSEISQLGELYLKQGKLDKGLEYFENILLRDDQKIDNYINVARAHLRKAEFKKSMDIYEDALRIAKTPQDSFNIYSNLNNYYITRGLSTKFLETDKIRLGLFAKFAPPVAVDAQYYNFQTIDRYKRCGALETLKPILNRIGKETTTAGIDLECIINLNYGLGAEDKEKLNGAYERCPDDIAKAISPLQSLLIGGLKDYINGNYEVSIESINQFIAQSGQPRQEMIAFIAAINNAAGKYEENIEELEKVLISDLSNSDVLLDLATAYKGSGNTAKAKSTLQKALDIWEDAENSYQPAQEAKALMAEM